MSAGPTPQPSVRNRWVTHGLRPAGLVVMTGCVCLPLAQVIGAVAPSLHPALLLAACVLAAIEVMVTHNVVRAHYTSGLDLFYTRGIEGALYFVALKAASVALNGLPPGPADAWLLDFHWWFDLETLLALLLAMAVAVSVDGALDDFDRVGEPAYPDRDYVPSADSLTGRFFTGGALLLLFSGLARVNLMDVFRTDRPPVTGLVGNVLIYFLIGLLLISQVRLELLQVQWQAQSVRTPPDLTARWVRYTLILVGLAALVAFALPTGYTLGSLGILSQVLSFIVGIFLAIAFAVIALFLLPFSWLASLLHLAPSTPGAVATPQPPPTLPSLPQQPLPAWLDTARTVLVILLVAGAVLYIVRSYLRERPELIEAVKRLAPLRGLGRLWAALRHRVSGALATAREAAPLAWLRERLQRAAPAGPLAFFRLGAAAPREQILFYYLSLLRRAGQQGFGRRPPQSPHEYEPVLEHNLPEAAPDLRQMTQTFEETRYSAHPVSPAGARRMRARWQQVRAALNRKKKNA